MLNMQNCFFSPSLSTLLRLILGFLAILPIIEAAQEPHSQATLEKAERLFAEQLYGDALPLYSLLFSNNSQEEQELKTLIALRLTTCCLKGNNPEAALSIISPLKTGSNKNYALYLMSFAQRQLQQPAQALALLNQIANIPNDNEFDSFVELEKGFHSFQLGDLINAQAHFKNIPLQRDNSLPYTLAQLQLAKIHLKTEQWESAREILIHSPHSLPPQHPLTIERMYLTGLLFLKEGQNDHAVHCFEQLLPKVKSSSKNARDLLILKNLAISYLRQALAAHSSIDQIKLSLSKAETVLQDLIERDPSESSYALLTDLNLIKAKRLHDSQAYAKAEQLFMREELFSSPEGKMSALLKCAEASPSYEKRNQLYQQLTVNSDYPTPFRSKVWFLQGLNEFEEALACQKQLLPDQMIVHLQHSAHAFEEATRLSHADSPESSHALKYLALAHAHQPGSINSQKAWDVLLPLLENTPRLSAFESPQEIACIAGWSALQLLDRDTQKKAQMLLQQGRQKFPSAKWSPISLKLEGLLSIQLGEWGQADEIFAALLNEEPHVTFPGELWFWRAHCAEQTNQPELRKKYLQNVYTLYPQSPYAPAAYFHLYSYRDYMRGQRKATKHLKAIPLMFPSHPLLISAHYLIGLDHKKDHLSEEGEVIRRRDLTAAIEAFQLAESTFDALYEKKLIPPEDLPYFIQVRYRAQFERAQANLAIAQQSQGGKRQIFLKYAEGVFQQLINDFAAPHPLIQTWLPDQSSYPKIWAEAELKLAQTYAEEGKEPEAENTLNASLSRYQEANTSHGYLLMRVWAEKGKLAQHQKNHSKALACYVEAEKAAGDFLGLSPDEKIDLWIQQSLCYKDLNQLDDAMLLLSKVINDDVISSLRIKAMFLRAEIYELQNRPELALKQLEAASHKGGEWAHQAQIKLEQVYGY